MLRKKACGVLPEIFYGHIGKVGDVSEQVLIK